MNDPAATIVYDGECPFCSRYVKLLRLRESIGRVELVDARQGGPVVDEIRRAGLNLDQGMVLKMDGQLHYGADCIHRLALLSTPAGWFNGMSRAIFRSPTASRLLYPVLRAGRNATLAALGRKPMGG